jgi:hypothetical protein
VFTKTDAAGEVSAGYAAGAFAISCAKGVRRVWVVGSNGTENRLKSRVRRGVCF